MSGDAAVLAAFEQAAVYRLFATMFAYPTPLRLAAVAEQAIAAAAAGAMAPIADVLAQLGREAATADVEALAAQYATLFDGPVRCPPYEGAWGPQQMSGKATQLADVAGFYAAFGLAPADGQADLEDHIAAECEFMSALALKEAYAASEEMAAALAVTREAQAAFVRDHLGRWTDAFAAELAQPAVAAFYREAAAGLARWVTLEAARLGVAPARVSGVAVAEPAPLACPMASPDTR